VRQSLSFNTFASIPCVVPSVAVVREFNRQWEHLRDGIRAREAQSESLTALRNTLLPKLISGELRLKHAGQIVKNLV
jgi:type I restriction enzyme S subunit